MGGQASPENVLDVFPILEGVVAPEDYYIRQKRLQFPSPTAQAFFLPLWKLLNAFHDCMVPIQANIYHILSLKTKLRVGTRAFRAGKHLHPCYQLVLSESARCHRLYRANMMRLRVLRSRTLNIFQKICSRREVMIQCYRRRCEEEMLDVGRVERACSAYARWLCEALDMSVVLTRGLMDSMYDGMAVLTCTKRNIFRAARLFSKHHLPLPNDLLSQNLMTSALFRVDLAKLGKETKDAKSWGGDLLQCAVRFKQTEFHGQDLNDSDSS